MQLLEDQDREDGTEDGLDVARTNLILELEQVFRKMNLLLLLVSTSQALPAFGMCWRFVEGC